MKILVTGASGFLGSHVADALSEHGHDVVLFDRQPSAYARPDQRMVVGSILDEAAFGAAMAGCDAVYHLAGIADIAEARDRPLDTVNVNIVGTATALDLARRHGLKRFVFASTIYVYSDHGSFYRTSKRACELLIEDYWEQHRLPFTILRFGSLYGPRANAFNSVRRMLASALHDGRLDYPGTGAEVREYIHVLDAAAAAADILHPDYQNENISLTGRERMTSREMMEMIREILGGSVELSFSDRTPEGHYLQTPYNYTPKIGKKMVRNTYIDLGLGLLDCLQEIDRTRAAETA